jgi:phenylalanyl-tRNA synthetase beta chain
MRILTDWLSEFTDVTGDTEFLADRLTDIGLEVEEILRLDRSIEEVVTARVEETNPHPDTRQLTVCDLVSDGTHAQVVTAAPGVEAGAVYCWAPPGSRLPDAEVEREDFQGVDSEGMLCSSRELGLTPDAQTLLKLPESVETGENVVDVLDLDEPILDIDLTPNRSDCLSHLGVARDLAAAEGGRLEDPRPESLEGDGETDVEIQIEEPEDCWSYTGVPLGNVNVTEAPFSIKKRILKMGLRPLNNVVDITNYTLFEVGHPLHPFDYDRLLPPVTVRRAEAEEQLRTLDGETRELSGDDLVIADKQGAQALAGIMGGANAQVGRRTERVLLEGAYFDPVRVRRTASRLKVSTEASHRFERGTDPLNVRRCLARCVELLGEDSAQEDLTVFDPVTVREREPSTTRIDFQPDGVEEVLGFEPERDTMKQQLDRLGIERNGDGDTWELDVPSWRHDLSREEDVIEEIVRLHGYEQIPTRMPSVQLDETLNPDRDMNSLLREFLVASGFNEVITYNFVDPDHHRFNPDGEPLKLENPLSRRTETMRRSILDELVELTGDHDDEEPSTRLFEIGRIFPDSEEEIPCLSFVMCGRRHTQRWTDCPELDFYDASGLVRAMFERVGHEDISLEPTESPGFHDHRTAEIIVGDQAVGRVGQIDDEQVPDEVDTILGAEIRLDDVPETDPVHFESYSTQPIVSRDLDLVVDRDQYVEPMRETIRSVADWLESITVFDVYAGDPLPEDKKSVSFNFSFRHPDRTLDAEEVNEVQDAIFEKLQEEFGATLRTE